MNIGLGIRITDHSGGGGGGEPANALLEGTTALTEGGVTLTEGA